MGWGVVMFGGVSGCRSVTVPVSFTTIARSNFIIMILPGVQMKHVG